MMSTMQRRVFLLGASAGLGASLLPTGARAAETTGTILVIGGSAMRGGVGRFIEDGLVAAGLSTQRHAKSSTGLARPDFHDWPAEAAKLHAATSPIATVCMFGGNDGQALHMGKGSDPEWIRWEDPQWSAEYGRRVEQLAEAIAPAGEPLLWVGMPIMRSSKLSARMQRLNEIFRTTMEARPGGHFIDTWSVLADGNGKFAETLVVGGATVAVRSEDGVHYTTTGAKILAEHVVPQVAAALGR